MQLQPIKVPIAVQLLQKVLPQKVIKKAFLVAALQALMAQKVLEVKYG